MNFTDAWGWPQWAMIGWWFLHFVIIASQNGQQILQSSGPEKGQPSRYNGFMAGSRIVTWAFILIAGGFFS